MRRLTIAIGRRGGTTIAVLLLLMVLTLLADGAIRRARYDALSTRASVVLVKERLALAAALDQAAQRALMIGSAPGAIEALRTMEVIQGALGPVEFSVEAVSSGSETVLFSAKATFEDRGDASSAARVVWFLDPVARIAALPAAITFGGDGGAAEVSPDLPGTARWPEEDLCAVLDAEIQRLRGGWPLPDHGSAGGVLLALGDSEMEGWAIPPLGLLSGPQVMARLEPLPDGGISWANDSGPTACGSGSAGSVGCLAPFVAGVGLGLQITGGDGRGVLATVEDLHLVGDAHFSGLLLVGGDLRVGANATFTGVAVVRGDVVTEAGASITARPCAAVAALRDAAALRRAVFPSWGHWMIPGASR